MPTDRRLARTLPLALALSLALSGCEDSQNGGVKSASNFGDANRMTLMAQVIDPDPQYSEPMQTSAEHAAQAVDRVRKDEVKKPDRVRSTQRSSGGGGGN